MCDYCDDGFHRPMTFTPEPGEPCLKCNRELPLDADYRELCHECWTKKEESRAEAAYEEWCTDNGGSAPVTLDEQHRAAWEVKHHG